VDQGEQGNQPEQRNPERLWVTVNEPMTNAAA
jgi:hypothetical protein